MMTTQIDLTTVGFTQHAKEDRVDRLSNCIATVGIGEIVFLCKSTRAKYPNEVVLNCVTSSGLVLIINATKNKIITGYLGTVRHVEGLYRGEGLRRLPDELFRTLRKNEKKYWYLYE